MSGRRLRPAAPLRLDDPEAEAANRSHRERIDEMQLLPIVNARFLTNVVLPDSTPVTLRHGLGKPPSAVFVSPGFRAGSSGGSVLELRDTYPSSTQQIDRSQVVVLEAFSFGGDVRVDVMVVP